MIAFRVFLAAIVAAVGAYTLVVGAHHGWNLLPVFFGNMLAMTWPGQFNTDFMGFLLLSGLWLAWRHRFSPAGLVLGLAGVFGGILLLASYLLVASFAAKGDMAVLMLGRERAAACGPVWVVTRRWPSRSSAASATACWSRQTRMPPALPRAPEWT